MYTICKFKYVFIIIITSFCMVKMGVCILLNSYITKARRKKKDKCILLLPMARV